jgi:hypothetical protein
MAPSKQSRPSEEYRSRDELEQRLFPKARQAREPAEARPSAIGANLASKLLRRAGRQLKKASS